MSRAKSAQNRNRRSVGQSREGKWHLSSGVVKRAANLLDDAPITIEEGKGKWGKKRLVLLAQASRRTLLLTS